MRAATVSGAVAALADVVLAGDLDDLPHALRALPEPVLALDEAAGLLWDVLAEGCRLQGLPGDDIDVRAVWRSGWPEFVAAETALDPEVAVAALHWLDSRLGGESWVPAGDHVLVLAFTVLLAVAAWGCQPLGRWVEFLMSRMEVRP